MAPSSLRVGIHPVLTVCIIALDENANAKLSRSCLQKTNDLSDASRRLICLTPSAFLDMCSRKNSGFKETSL